MKSKILSLLLIFIIFLFNFNIKALDQESAGETGGSSGNIESDKDEFKWSWDPSYPGRDTIKISLYKLDGSFAASRFFVNDADDPNELNGKTHIRTNGTDRLSESVVQGTWIKSSNDTFSYLNFDNFFRTNYNEPIKTFLKNFTEKEAEEMYNGSDKNNLVIVVEPAMTVKKKSDGTLYTGTYWDFYWLNQNNSDFSYVMKKNIMPDLGSSISIKSTEISQIKTPGIWTFLTHFNTFQGNVTKQTSNGVAIILYSDFFEIEPEPINCSVNVNITECGKAEIIEETRKDCIVDNSVYSYESSCNLYCADSITTDFSGLYNTFKGDNNFNAIPSGRFKGINGNPTITITKTCYQSKASNECPNVELSFKQKLQNDYKTNNMILDIDGSSYTLIGTPVISNSGYSSATITYEYRLEDQVNKFIGIENGQGVILTDEIKNKVTTKGYPMIEIIKKTYGTYSYSLDVSGTVLNKYLSNGSTVRNLENSKNNKYDITNKLIVNYNGNGVTGYTKEDLNYSCSYVAYNTEEGCICAEDTKCDPVTCEPIVDDDPCTCDSERGCGCYDTKDCKPIPCPCIPGEPDCPIPPTKEYPNIVYRPISLDNPFPGINGNGRDPGRNWIGMARDEHGNIIHYRGNAATLIDYYITYNRGYTGYELYEEAEPLYVISLDATKIKAIREYNDYMNHDYNENDLKCKNDGTECVSKFLRGTADHFHINLIDSGTCKTITSSTFYSCVTRK